MMSSALHLLVNNELKTWPRQRITGGFVFAREASDGSALVVALSGQAQLTDKVYKVVGISTSLGDLLRSNGQSLPACLVLTLLPYMEMIVYDGTLRGMPIPSHLGAAEIDAVLDCALAEGRVQTALPAPADAPLEGKPVRISGLQAKPELNGQIGSCADFVEDQGRYAVRLSDGKRVALKPANLVVVSDAEAKEWASAHAAAGTVVGSELTPYQLESRAEIMATKAMSPSETLPGPGGRPEKLNFWVFRRYGYTEAQNPQHTFMVMAGPMPLPKKHGPPVPPGVDPMTAMMMGGFSEEDVWHKASALAPTVDDVLKAFRSSLKHPMWASRGKPPMIAVDAKEIVDRLEEILKPCGVHAGYYPPPSNEELMTIPGGDVGGGV